jgi:hypothetical protein
LKRVMRHTNKEQNVSFYLILPMSSVWGLEEDWEGLNPQQVILFDTTYEFDLRIGGGLGGIKSPTSQGLKGLLL